MYNNVNNIAQISGEIRFAQNCWYILFIARPHKTTHIHANYALNKFEPVYKNSKNSGISKDHFFFTF